MYIEISVYRSVCCAPAYIVSILNYVSVFLVAVYLAVAAFLSLKFKIFRNKCVI